MTIIHNLGFPRFGAKRELKFALEKYWAGDIDAQELKRVGKELRERHWQLQADAGVDLIPVGDFAWYDHILEWSCLLGVIPARFEQEENAPVDLDTLFRVARGRAPSGKPAAASEMTKWFDTNYHYIVPELEENQQFRIARETFFEQVAEAQAKGHNVKAVIPGPLTYLYLAKGEAFPEADDAGKLSLLNNLVPVYREVLKRLADKGVEWVQVDEPILALDLPDAWQRAFVRTYEQLAVATPKVIVATYFGALQDNLFTALELAVEGLHIDGVRAPEEVAKVVERIGADKVLSIGLIDGRNIWRTDLDAAIETLNPVKEQLGDRLWLAPSCSLLHVPVDLVHETKLDDELKSWLSFAQQKLEELQLLRQGLDNDSAATAALTAQREAIANRRTSTRIHNPAVQERMAKLNEIAAIHRPAFNERIEKQRAALNLPLFPTTTIGSFPQTAEIRALRRDFKRGDITFEAYEKSVKEVIAEVVQFQVDADIDVLVHGEAERNDMVEYFGELLEGFAFTQNGWVQSYGSRGVKPPVIFGDVSRPNPMTVSWTTYAQSLTDKPMKGMLTGPVTILEWSFVRDDQTRKETCEQIALAIRDEVNDLEAAGITVIQVDEPAFREGLPLRQADWKEYLDWAAESFRISTAGVQDTTQIHTHMCYSEFNNIIEAIASMDADVITIETSRSHMELLEAFEKFEYPNDIGPGVYDIHSPNIPDVEWMVELIKRATKQLPKEKIWVNPDCGLKTRRWEETKPALEKMVKATKVLREKFSA